MAGVSRSRKPLLQRIKNNLIFALARGVIFLAGLIPLSWGTRIGAAAGRLAFFLLRSDRRKTLTHLRIAFPEKEEAWRVETGRRAMMNLGRSFFELFHFAEILEGVDGRGKYTGYLEVEGAEHLAGELAGGNGALCVTGHCGNWELMAAYTARLGFPLHAVARTLYDRRLNDLLNRHRERFGYMPVVRDGKEAAQEIARVFQANEVIGILMDQDTQVRGVFVPFFGHLANTPVGPAYLAYRARKNALPCFMHRRPEGGHRLVIGAPIPRPETGSIKGNVQAYTAAMTLAVEENIRRHPDEWVWMHCRWRRRPPGEPPEKNPVALTSEAG